MQGLSQISQKKTLCADDNCPHLAAGEEGGIKKSPERETHPDPPQKQLRPHTQTLFHLLL